MRVVAALLISAMAVFALPTPALADNTRDGQWYLDGFEIDKVHELSQGEGVTIGVIDSGIDAEHPDLQGNVKAGSDFGDSKGEGLIDATGHGTNVASLIVGHGHGDNGSDGVLGIAPKAKVISAGFNCKGPCYGGDLISEAIIWLVDEGVDIISISLGTGHYDNKAVAYATENSVAVVASAGNDDPNELEKLAGAEAGTTTGWPASAIGSIPVSGTTQSGEFWEHSLTLKDASAQPKLGLSAPAEDLVVAKKGGGYVNVSGTSGAAPIVAGTLALVKSAYPELTHEQVNERLLFTVDDKGAKGYDDQFGWGIVNPYRALTEDVKHFKGGTSTKSDMIPLDKQGQDSSGDSKEKDSSSSAGGQALSGSSSSTWLIVGGVIVAVVLVATVIAVLVIAKRRGAGNVSTGSGAG